MNPPLRHATDRDALVEGLKDGTVDVIATDHAPHHADDKKVEFDRASFGIVGLETAVSLSLDRLVHGGIITLARMVELLSANPARILARAGEDASRPATPPTWTILAPELNVTVSTDAFRSKSRNTPSTGGRCRGGWPPPSWAGACCS